MPISNNGTLDTAYVEVIAEFDDLASNLESAATEENNVAAGNENDEYNIASDILASDAWRKIQDRVNQMRLESSASDTAKFYDR